MNLTSLEGFRNIQELEKYEKGFIPSRQTVQRTQNKFTKFMSSRVPFYHEYVEELSSEIAYFDPEQLLEYLLEQYGLKETAMHDSVEIAVTADGATLMNDIGHVTIGYKIVDKRARLPESLRHLKDGFQSVNLCFPIRTIVSSESKDVYMKFLKPVYDFVSNISEHGFGCYKKFKVLGPHDGKATFNVLSRGGGAKVAKYFCPYCVCTSEDIMTCKTSKLICCVSCNEKNTTCKHWDVMDKDMIQHAKNFLEVQGEGYSDLRKELYFCTKEFTDLLQGQHLQFKNAPNKSRNPLHIDFDFINASDNQASYFWNAIKKNILARQRFHRLNLINIHKSEIFSNTVRDRLHHIIQSLRNELELEDKIAYMRTILEQDEEAKHDRLLPVHTMVPDSMHLLNRVIERIIKMLFLMGSRESERLGRNKDVFVKEIENIVNSKNFRDKNGAIVEDEVDVDANFLVGKRWSYPMGERGELVGDVKMSFSFAKRFFSKIHLLYQVCLPPSIGILGTTFKRAVQRFNEIMDMLQMHDDIDENVINDLENKIGLFADDWIASAGLDGMTNYVHYLISGHILYFLRLHKNLYRYSQQGWEAMNSWLKTYFLRKTQRGGHGMKQKTYLLPLYRHLQRSYGWRTGLGDSYFSNESGPNANENEEIIEATEIEIEAAAVRIVQP